MAKLQQDMRVKDTSLSIDRSKCMGARGDFPANLQCGASARCRHRYHLIHLLHLPHLLHLLQLLHMLHLLHLLQLLNLPLGRWCTALGSFTIRIHAAY